MPESWAVCLCIYLCLRGSKKQPLAQHVPLSSAAPGTLCTTAASTRWPDEQRLCAAAARHGTIKQRHGECVTRECTCTTVVCTTRQVRSVYYMLWVTLVVGGCILWYQIPSAYDYYLSYVWHHVLSGCYIFTCTVMSHLVFLLFIRCRILKCASCIIYIDLN